MNGEPSDPDAEVEAVWTDPLGIIQPPYVAPEMPPAFCEECGGLDFHLDNCPAHHGPAWVKREERRDALLKAADSSIPRLALTAARRVSARLLRRLARSLDV